MGKGKDLLSKRFMREAHERDDFHCKWCCTLKHRWPHVSGLVAMSVFNNMDSTDHLPGDPKFDCSVDCFTSETMAPVPWTLLICYTFFCVSFGSI